MLKSRSLRLTIVLTIGSLPLLGTTGAVHLGDRPEKGIAPLCLLTPASPDCKDGVIS